MAAPYVAMHKKRSQKLQQGELTPEEAQAIIGDNAAYYEAIMIGAIEGGTSNFNEDCKSGL